MVTAPHPLYSGTPPPLVATDFAGFVSFSSMGSVSCGAECKKKNKGPSVHEFIKNIKIIYLPIL